MLDSLLHDLRYSARTLGRNPGFAAISILALALGIGANSTIFTVVRSLLLKPPAFGRPERLVIVRERNLTRGLPRFSLSPGNYLDFRDHNRTFSGIGVSTGGGLNLADGSTPERLRGSRITTNYLAVLGVSPLLGRDFTAGEGEQGADHVVILGYGLWQRRFAGDRAMLGRSLKLNEEIYTVVGVMPPGFETPGRTEIWTPLSMNSRDWRQRGGHYLNGIGRLRDGATIAAAEADLNHIAGLAEQQFPDSNRGWDTTLQDLREAYVGQVRPALLTLMGAVGFVLLIACVNLANLLLSRATARRKEMGTRGALGAGRGRLARQLLTESLLLASLGGAAGLAVAWGCARAVAGVSPAILPRANEVALDWQVAAFTALVTAATGILFGLAPAFQLAALDIWAALRESARGNAIAFRRNRLRSGLVVGEVALSLVLLSGAGLLMRSFARLAAQDTGFDPHGVLTFYTNLPAAHYHTGIQIAAFYRRAIEKLKVLPGVAGAGAGQIFPLAGDDCIMPFTQLGKPPVAAGQQPNATFYAVTPGYFRALRIPIRAGRELNERDVEAGPPVALVSESMARKFYPAENPIGQRIQMARGDKPVEIVGVVGDVRDQELESIGRPAVYQPAAQVPYAGMYFGVRSQTSPEQLISAVRAAIRDLDPDLPLDGVGAVDDLVAESLGQRRLAMLLMAIFAALALTLAMVGIYGVISYSVMQATQEIGIRLALGAGRGHVLGMVLWYGGRLVAAGLAIGLAGAIASSRLLASQLYEIRPADPATLAIVSAALAAVGLAACTIPAWRAMRVDPLTALRIE